jgi:hypothetical protein
VSPITVILSTRPLTASSPPSHMALHSPYSTAPLLSDYSVGGLRISWFHFTPLIGGPFGSL